MRAIFLSILATSFSIGACATSEPHAAAALSAPGLSTLLIIVVLAVLALALAATNTGLLLDRRRMEQSRVESEERATLAMLSAKLGLARWDAKTDEFWASSQLRTMLGLDETTRLTRERLHSSIHPDDRGKFKQALESSMASMQPVDAEFRAITRSGGVRWLHATFSASASPGARVTVALADVTERLKSEQRWQQHRQQVTRLRSAAALGELSGALTHELNQPLASILSNAQAAQHFIDELPMDLAELREILHDIVEEDKRAGEVVRTVNTLLNQERECCSVSLPLLVHEVLAVAELELRSGGIGVKARMDEGLRPLQGNQAQLRQVLTNILLYLSRGAGRINATQPDIEIAGSFDAASGTVHLLIADRTREVSDAEYHRIAQFSAVRDAKAGIGLAVCRAIINAHDGRLWVERSDDCRVSFHITLPAFQEELA